MSKIKSAVTLGALALVLLSGIATALPAASAVTTVQVSIPQGAGNPNGGAPGYSPDKIVVVIGVNNTVEWTNNDNLASHTVTSDPGNGTTINSGNMVDGATYSLTFTTPGTYNYYCVYHSWMTGTVVVKASTNPSPEFPTALLAVILFAVMAAAVVAAPRIRPRLSSMRPG